MFAVERVAQLEPHMDAWRRLASSVPDPNVFYSPAFLVPNLELIEDRPFVLLFVYREPTADLGRTLIAVAPFTVNPPTLKRPFPHLQSLQNRYVYETNPLVDPAYTEAAWDALLHVLQDPAQPWHFADLVLESDSDGPPPPALVRRVPATRAISCWKGFAQSWLHKPLTFEEFVHRLGSKTWSNHRRRLRQLGELGTVELQLRRRCEDVAAVVDDFLSLERSGWKGSEGTAMACEQRDVEFLHQVARNFNADAGLFYIELRLDDRLIAVSLAHALGTTVSALKITYDEAFARYSPGVVIAIETIRRFIQDPHLAQAHGGTPADSWASRFFMDVREPCCFGVPTRRPQAVAFSWGLKCFNRLRRIDIGSKLVAQHEQATAHASAAPRPRRISPPPGHTVEEVRSTPR